MKTIYSLLSALCLLATVSTNAFAQAECSKIGKFFSNWQIYKDNVTPARWINSGANEFSSLSFTYEDNDYDSIKGKIAKATLLVDPSAPEFKYSTDPKHFWRSFETTKTVPTCSLGRTSSIFTITGSYKEKGLNPRPAFLTVTCEDYMESYGYIAARVQTPRMAYHCKKVTFQVTAGTRKGGATLIHATQEATKVPWHIGSVWVGFGGDLSLDPNVRQRTE